FAGATRRVEETVCCHRSTRSHSCHLGDHRGISPVRPRSAGAPKGSERSRFCLAEWERGDGRAVGPPHARSGGGCLLPRRLVTVLPPAVAGLSAKTAGDARAWRRARRHLAAAA